MIKLRQIIFVSVCLLGIYSFVNKTNDTSPFVGQWKCKSVTYPWPGNVEIIDSRKDNYNSIISFFEDGTWTKTTDNLTRNGFYKHEKPNKLDFLEKNKEGELETIYSMRWPKGKFDPDVLTPEIDFIFPETMLIKTPDGDTVESQVDGHYVQM